MIAKVNTRFLTFPETLKFIAMFARMGFILSPLSPDTVQYIIPERYIYRLSFDVFLSDIG
jgi:hypothetical protein